MKKLFTLAVVATVAAGAFAHPAKFDGVKGELTPAAQQIMNTNVAALEQNRLTDINGEILSKRTYISGNIEWDMYAIKTGTVAEMVKYGDGSTIDFDDLPMYAVEYALMGYNRTTGQRTSVLAMMLMWPSEYYRQLMTWTGPWDHYVETNSQGQSYDVYDIPMESRDYTIVPIEELLPEQPLAAPFKYTGYFFFTREGEVDQPEQWPGPYCWGAIGYNGLSYNGKAAELDPSGFDPKTGAGACPTVTFNDYLLEGIEENFSVSNNLPMQIGVTDANGKFTSTGTTTLNLDYEGTGFSNGFVPKDYTIVLDDLHFFNAGLLDEDTNRFYEMPEDGENLQQFYVLGCDDNLVIGWSQDDDEKVQEDPSFTTCVEEKRYVKFFLSSSNPNPDGDNAYYFYGYMFSKDGVTKPADAQWNLKLATTNSYEFMGQVYTYYDWLVPQADMIVPFGVRTENGISAWSQTYGLAGVFKGYSAYPEKEGAYMAINTPDGFVFNYKDEFDNSYNLSYVGDCVYHPDFENITTMELIATEGTFVPDVDEDAVKTIFGDLSGVQVSARNGMISVNAANAADVQIFTLNGQLVKAAKVNGNNSVAVAAAKGAYIVKVGDVVRKVIL